MDYHWFTELFAIEVKTVSLEVFRFANVKVRPVKIPAPGSSVGRAPWVTVHLTRLRGSGFESQSGPPLFLPSRYTSLRYIRNRLWHCVTSETCSAKQVLLSTRQNLCYRYIRKLSKHPLCWICISTGTLYNRRET